MLGHVTESLLSGLEIVLLREQVKEGGATLVEAVQVGSVVSAAMQDH